MTDGSAEAERILRARAKLLAVAPHGSMPAGATLELLEFRLAAERYALETRHIQEVHPLRDLTPLPVHAGFRAGHRQCARPHSAGARFEEVLRPAGAAA